METQKSKIVITSLGVSSSIGNSMDSFFDNYEKEALQENSHINDENLEQELGNFSSVNQRRMDRLTKITMNAAVNCIEDTKLTIDDTNINEVGGIFCTEYGPIASARNFVHSGFELGLDSASPLIFPYTVGNAAPGAIAVYMKARGFSTTVQGYNPLAYAYDVIKDNKAKAILAGGFEELIPEMEEAYSKRSVLKNNGEREVSALKCMTEGSAMLFVENEEFAIARNANVLFELCGYSVSSNLQREEKSIDNFGYIAPGIIHKVMDDALKKSDLNADQISLVISMGREDSKQVESEAEAIRSVWSENTPEVHYIKKILGETFGASDSFATIVGYLKGKDLKKENGKKSYVMINSYHIGGNCFSLIIAV